MSPETMASTSPDWGWLIVGYLFVGGIAGGALFLASMLKLRGRAADGPLIRLGHYLALGGAVICGLLLTVDLTKPLRFWHMLLEPNTLSPTLKTWSPMSVGAWGLVVFSVVALLAALGSWAEERRPDWRAAVALGRGAPARVIAAAGVAGGLFLAGYTGVLLAVTNQPVWADSSWLGLLFLLSGVSSGAAILVLLGERRLGLAASGLGWLTWMDRRVRIAELVALVVFVISLGPVVRSFASWLGLLVTVVVGVGMVAPWLLERRRATYGLLAVLVAGLLLRVAVVFSPGLARYAVTP